MFSIVREATPFMRKRTNVGGRPLRYPYDKLEVGDAIEFTGISKTLQKAYLKELKTAYAYGRRHSKKFSLISSDRGIQLLRIA